MTNNQIDKLGLDLRKGLIDADRLRRLELFRSEFAPAYGFVEGLLVHTLRLRITGRPSKSTVAIVEKLKRETIRLSQIQDIAGCRVLVPNIFVQNSLVRDLNLLLDLPEIDDKRENPTNGYRAVHVIAKHAGRPVEIQVRTFTQHAWAEMSEKLADALGQSIKYGRGVPWAVEFLSELSRLTKKLENYQFQKADAQIKVNYSQRMVYRARYARQENACLAEIRQLFAKASLEGVA